MQAWIVRGKPLSDRTLGSFEHWAQVMGGILDCAGIEHFLGNLGDFYDRLDAEGRMWREFCEAAFERFAGRSARVTEYNELCAERDLLLPVRGDKGEKSQRIRLGKALTRVSDRVFGEYVVIPATDRHCKSQMYAVVKSGGDTEAGLAGCSEGPLTLNQDEKKEVVYGEGRGPNTLQLPAEQGNLLPANDLAHAESARNIPQTSRRHPASGLPVDTADWPDERRDVYEERCGIMEFDGLVPRGEAERLAETEARRDSRKEEGT